MRNTSKCVCFLGVYAAIACLVSLAILGETVDYSLTAAPCGAIAWIGGEPLGGTRWAEEAKRTIDNVFTFWQIETVEPPRAWRYPMHAPTNATVHDLNVQLRDYGTGRMWTLTTRTWEDGPIYPLIVVVYPTTEALRESIDRNVIGMFGGSMGALDAPPRIRRLLSHSPLIATSLRESMGVLAHETAHWATFLWCMRENTILCDLPEAILEGIAELTEERVPSNEGRQREYLAYGFTAAEYVHAWAAQHELSDLASLSGTLFDSYIIGESLVTYLVDCLGPRGFLETLADWAADPDAMFAAHDAGWRAWLAASP